MVQVGQGWTALVATRRSMCFRVVTCWDYSKTPDTKQRVLGWKPPARITASPHSYMECPIPSQTCLAPQVGLLERQTDLRPGNPSTTVLVAAKNASDLDLKQLQRHRRPIAACATKKGTTLERAKQGWIQTCWSTTQSAGPQIISTNSRCESFLSSKQVQSHFRISRCYYHKIRQIFHKEYFN